MRYIASMCCLLVLHPCARAQDKAHDQALALQKVLQKTIAQAEPAIACVLVSRSEAYRRLAGQLPTSDHSGKLGDYDSWAAGFPKDERLALNQKYDLADPGHVPEAFGSGVVIDPQGLVLTNYHVIRDATKVLVRLPGAKASYADIHAADPRSDLAVLRVLNPRILPLPALPLGDAAMLERGQFVLTLANPYAAGFRDGQPSASYGILSNLRRRVPGLLHEGELTKPLYHYGTLLQTDTRTHLGCSGGALLTLKGELVGLTTSLAAIHGSDTPGGFALPLDSGMRRILEVLRRGEEVEYGFLGVRFDEQRLEAAKGVIVKWITPGSPAQRDGNLHEGDAILAVNEVPIQESDDLFLQLGTHLAGQKVILTVQRAGMQKPAPVEVTLGKFYVVGKKIASSTGKRPFYRGLRVDSTTLLVQQAPRLTRVPAGVLVSEVQPSTAAALAQLKPGEIITHVNQRPVTTPAAFYQAVAALQGPIELQLYSFGTHDPPARAILK